MVGPDVQAHHLQTGATSNQEPPPRSCPGSTEENSTEPSGNSAFVYHQKHH